MKIFIDPGHGICRDSSGFWEYARSEHYGVREDLLTANLAVPLADLLWQQGHEVVVSRFLPGTDEGEEIGKSGLPQWKEAAIYCYRKSMAGHPLYKERGSSERGKAINSRPLWASQLECDLAVSLHHNASGNNPRAHGTSVWHRHADPRSSRFAGLVYDEILAKDPRYDGRRGIKGDGPGWESEHAQRLAWFKRMDESIPCILVEFLFFTNRDDAALLSQEEHLNNAAEGIFKGIETFRQEMGV